MNLPRLLSVRTKTKERGRASVLARTALIAGVAILCTHVRMQAQSPPTFSHDIAPIVKARCIQCHRPAGIASMAPFTTYESVKPWAHAIRQAVTLHQMPPWPPDPARSMKLANDPTLSAREIATIQAWVDAGAPQGQSVASVDLNAAATQWQGPDGRPPDLVISMPKAAQIPASGDLPYVRFLAKVPLASDQWIMACQARPGNASVVHHMAVTEVEIPPGVSPADINGMEQLARMMGGSTSVVQPLIASSSKPNLVDMLAIYTPGIGLETYPANTGSYSRAVRTAISISTFTTPRTARLRAIVPRSPSGFETGLRNGRYFGPPCRPTPSSPTAKNCCPKPQGKEPRGPGWPFRPSRLAPRTTN